MSREEERIYLKSPFGDVILLEAFKADSSVALIFGENRRVDLDLESAIDLADILLLITSESRNL